MGGYEVVRGVPPPGVGVFNTDPFFIDRLAGAHCELMGRVRPGRFRFHTSKSPIAFGKAAR